MRDDPTRSWLASPLYCLLDHHTPAHFECKDYCVHSEETAAKNKEERDKLVARWETKAAQREWHAKMRFAQEKIEQDFCDKWWRLIAPIMIPIMIVASIVIAAIFHIDLETKIVVGFFTFFAISFLVFIPIMGIVGIIAEKRVEKEIQEWIKLNPKPQDPN